jgi:hypothetical protein
MRKLRILIPFGVAAVGLFARSAGADQVILDNGEVLEGKALEEGDSVVVRLDIGTVTLEKSEVREIKRGETALDELQKKKAGAKGESPAELHQIATWAKQHGLDSKARDLYRRIVAIAPNDAKAHQELGDRQLEGKWLSEDEYMIAKGFVMYEGTWRTKDDIRALEAEDRERRERVANRERIDKLEGELARMRGDQAAEERDLDEYARRFPYGSYSGWPYWGFWPYGRFFGRALAPFHRLGFPRHAGRVAAFGSNSASQPRPILGPGSLPGTGFRGGVSGSGGFRTGISGGMSGYRGGSAGGGAHR